jgi:hypothetical protein
MSRLGKISRLFDHNRSDSLSARLRRRRWEQFRELTSSVARPMKILDVGGEQLVWEMIGFADQPDIHITLLNIQQMPSDHANIESVQGDACGMQQFGDKEFDIVFSNSLIEHVGDEVKIRQCAEEIRRVGKNYFVQTPNRYFPVEPHFVFPMFQFLPIGVSTALVQNFRLGWMPKCPNRAEAEAAVRSIRLLSKQEMQALFPEGRIIEERLLGMTKSIQSCLFASESPSFAPAPGARA